ncbi:MAG: site-specific DNA-methyltransferase, partial [Candidatus Omnitrophica bacterium]|nr:site-specific DNA-methyltransferase [Candidatus Omnitrophota bacterium]
RDYGIEGQLGLEPSFHQYISNLCDIFDGVKRCLKNDGTCWVNLGDSYAGQMGKKNGWTDAKLGYRKQEVIDKGICLTKKIKIIDQLPQKCLVGIPFRFAIEMVNRGWILRNTIIWHKLNCMPSSAKDRFTVDFEYIFFFSKKKKYWFEQQLIPCKEASFKRAAGIYTGSYAKHKKTAMGIKTEYGNADRFAPKRGRNKRSVWTINTKPFKGAHFAVYPEQLVETPIKAGCPERGIVLDPFFGAGTTGLVALKQNKNFIGIELNNKYIEIAKRRLKPFMK